MMNGPCRRGPERWSERASRSLPTPGSPERSTWTGRIDREPELLDDLLHRQRLAHHQVGVERQVLLPRVARQDRLVPPDVMHQPEHQQVARGR